MSEDEPAAKITMTAIYTELRNVADTVNSLNARLPNHIEQTDKNITDVRKDVSDHERRIRAMETKLWAAVGGFGLIAAASPYLSRAFIP